MTRQDLSQMVGAAVPTDAAVTVWVNGERHPASGTHVSARDRGLTLADGLFETMHARTGKVFRRAEHLERLATGLGVISIPVPDELSDWVDAAVAHWGPGDASVRLTVTRGAGAAGVAPPPDLLPTVIVIVGPMPHFTAAVYEQGLSANVASGRRNERSFTAGLKTIAYTESIAALLEAQRSGVDEALFLDTQGHCSEATSSNLFIVNDRTLITPHLSCGVLPGITRAAILELAPALGLQAVERELELDELLRADEAFLTSSLRGLAPLVKIEGRPIGAGVPGATTRMLAEAYAGLVTRECGS